MKFFTPIAASLVLVLVSAQIRGFSNRLQNFDDSCKSVDDYVADFNAIDGTDKVFRIYSTIDRCGQNAISLLLDAANRAKGKILVGLWAVGSGFENEKKALWDAVNEFGGSSIVGVVVASESLYRSQYKGSNEITSHELAMKIYDVKGMVQDDRSTGGLGLRGVPVGTADYWSTLVDSRNAEVLQAVNTLWIDFIPYSQGYGVGNALDVLSDAISRVDKVLLSVNPSANLAVGETGWPAQGRVNAYAIPSIENYQKYWVKTFCKLKGMGLDAYWFEAFDAHESDYTQTGGHNWGAYDSKRQAKFDVSCKD